VGKSEDVGVGVGVDVDVDVDVDDEGESESGVEERQCCFSKLVLV
jgi:hypothetical protein